MSLRRFLLVRFGRLITYPVRRQLPRFFADCERPDLVQSVLRDQILTIQRDTQFGRDHHFDDINTAADYRRNVPIAPYEYVAPYIEKVQKELKGHAGDGSSYTFQSDYNEQFIGDR